MTGHCIGAWGNGAGQGGSGHIVRPVMRNSPACVGDLNIWEAVSGYFLPVPAKKTPLPFPSSRSPSLHLSSPCPRHPPLPPPSFPFPSSPSPSRPLHLFYPLPPFLTPSLIFFLSPFLCLPLSPLSLILFLHHSFHFLLPFTYVFPFPSLSDFLPFLSFLHTFLLLNVFFFSCFFSFIFCLLNAITSFRHFSII